MKKKLDYILVIIGSIGTYNSEMCCTYSVKVCPAADNHDLRNQISVHMF